MCLDLINFWFYSYVFLIASMKENSKNDTLSRKALFSQFSQKTWMSWMSPVTHLMLQSGYTLHLKMCSQRYTCFTTE